MRVRILFSTSVVPTNRDTLFPIIAVVSLSRDFRAEREAINDTCESQSRLGALLVILATIIVAVHRDVRDRDIVACNSEEISALGKARPQVPHEHVTMAQKPGIPH